VSVKCISLLFMKPLVSFALSAANFKLQSISSMNVVNILKSVSDL